MATVRAAAMARVNLRMDEGGHAEALPELLSSWSPPFRAEDNDWGPPGRWGRAVPVWGSTSPRRVYWGTLHRLATTAAAGGLTGRPWCILPAARISVT